MFIFFEAVLFMPRTIIILEIRRTNSGVLRTEGLSRAHVSTVSLD
jgi:hypothetical protein